MGRFLQGLPDGTVRFLWIFPVMIDDKMISDRRVTLLSGGNPEIPTYWYPDTAVGMFPNSFGLFHISICERASCWEAFYKKLVGLDDPIQ